MGGCACVCASNTADRGVRSLGSARPKYRPSPGFMCDPGRWLPPPGPPSLSGRRHHNVVGGCYPWEGRSSWLGVEGKLTFAAKCHSSVLMCFQYYDENKWGRKPSGEGTRREEEKQGSEETGKRRESLVRREEAAEAKQPERATRESGRTVHFCAG